MTQEQSVSDGDTILVWRTVPENARLRIQGGKVLVHEKRGQVRRRGRRLSQGYRGEVPVDVGRPLYLHNDSDTTITVYKSQYKAEV